MLARYVVSLPLFLFLSVDLLSLFVFVMSVAVSHSSTPPLKAVILSPSLTVRLMFGPPSAGFCSAVLVISRHCFRCYLSTPHAV